MNKWDSANNKKTRPQVQTSNTDGGAVQVPILRQRATATWPVPVNGSEDVELESKARNREKMTVERDSLKAGGGGTRAMRRGGWKTRCDGYGVRMDDADKFRNKSDLRTIHEQR